MQVPHLTAKKPNKTALVNPSLIKIVRMVLTYLALVTGSHLKGDHDEQKRISRRTC